jgi:hypothetical protein
MFRMRDLCAVSTATEDATPGVVINAELEVVAWNLALLRHVGRFVGLRYERVKASSAAL